MRLPVIPALLLLTATIVQLSAQLPPVISYQGRVQVGSTNFTGTGQFKFAMVDAGTNMTLWSNDGTSLAGSQPSAAVNLPVNNGLFTALLGDASLSNMTAIPAAVFLNAGVHLRVWFNDGALGFVQLAPDQRLGAVGNAFVAATVPDGSISDAQVGSLSGSKITGALNLASDSLIVGGSQLALVGGNVGIGDSTPAATLTVGNGDKFQVAGADGDLTFTDDQASIRFPATDGTNAPMIFMFAGGAGNGDRMVIAHSPTFPNWGLQYSDQLDLFHFLAGGVRGISIDPPNRTVWVGDNTGNTNILLLRSTSVGAEVLGYNRSARQTLLLDADALDGGALLQLENTNSVTTIVMDAQSGSGSQLLLLDGSGTLANRFEVITSTNSGTTLTAYNRSGASTVFLDSDLSGAGYLQLDSSNGVGTVLVDAGSGSGSRLALFDQSGGNANHADLIVSTNSGFSLTAYNRSTVQTVLLDSDAADGSGYFQLDNVSGAATVTLDADSGSGSFLRLTDENGGVPNRIQLTTVTNSGASIFMYNRSGNTGIFMDSDANDGGALVQFANTNGLGRINLDADDGTAAHLGRVGINRLASANALEVEGEASKTVAGGWVANSDRRIKTDIRPVHNALEQINRVRPVSFHYTEEYRRTNPQIRDIEYFNVVAQEFADVFPDAVKEGGDQLENGEKVLQVDTYPAAIHAIAAIQELHSLVREKDRRINALEKKAARVDQLESRLSALEAMVSRLPSPSGR